MSTAGQQEQARPMRQRIARLRPRSMAQRAAGDDRFVLSPRGRRIAGWLAAVILVLGVAAVVRFLGGAGEGAPVGAGPSGSPGASGGDLPPIAFGTVIDAATGEVSEASYTDTFAAGDTFAYSVAPGEAVPDPVYVEVRRTSPDAAVVQEAVEGQDLPDPRVIAFRVPADDLLEVFGPGEYLMLIYADPAAPAIAEGTFELVSTDAAPSASKSASSP